MLGEAQVDVAGGVESMSRAPLVMGKASRLVTTLVHELGRREAEHGLGAPEGLSRSDPWSRRDRTVSSWPPDALLREA